MLVVGSEGQDGKLLFRRLADEGCRVVGLGNKTSRSSLEPAPAPVDILNSAEVHRVVSAFCPEAVFYLAAAHSSSQQRDVAGATLLRRSFEVNTIGLGNFLDAIERIDGCRLFYAASSMVFGDHASGRQTENTPHRPTSFYGMSKAAGVQLCQHYRRRGGHISSGILYNHESPGRLNHFVSQKIVQGAVAIARGAERQLILGDFDAGVDWGYAPDFVDAMLRIVGHDVGDDYIVATGELHTVGEFAEIAFRTVGLHWRDHVIEDGSVVQRRRSALAGDASLLRERTGWRPTVTFPEMVTILVRAAERAHAV